MPVERHWYTSATATVLAVAAAVGESAMIALIALGLLLIAGRDAFGGSPTLQQ